MTDTTISAGERGAGGPLEGRQVLVSGAFGAALWLLAAVVLRAVGPMGAFEGAGRVVLYALLWPATLPFVFVLRAVAGLGRGQLVSGVAVATAAAAILDGLALAWAPALYGGAAALVAGSGAAILWGVGVALILALLLDRRG